MFSVILLMVSDIDSRNAVEVLLERFTEYKARLNISRQAAS